MEDSAYRERLTKITILLHTAITIVVVDKRCLSGSLFLNLSVIVCLASSCRKILQDVHESKRFNNGLSAVLRTVSRRTTYRIRQQNTCASHLVHCDCHSGRDDTGRRAEIDQPKDVLHHHMLVGRGLDDDDDVEQRKQNTASITVEIRF